MKFGYKEGDMITCNVSGEVILFETNKLRITALAQDFKQMAPNANVSSSELN